MWQRRIFFWEIILTLLTLPVLAAPTAADENMDTLAVTGKRYVAPIPPPPTPLPQSTADKQVITRQEIEKSGAVTVAEALQKGANLQVMNTGTGFGQTLSVRGLPLRDVLILVDGQRLAGEDTSTTQNRLTLGRLNLHRVDHIEVLQGVEAAQYGADALGGVINIVSKAPAATSSVTAGVSTGTTASNNYYHIDLGKNGRFSATLAMNFTKERPWMRHDMKIATGRLSIGHFPAENLTGDKQQYQFQGTYDLSKTKKLQLDLGYGKDNLEGNWGPFQLDLPFPLKQRTFSLPQAKLETSQRNAALTFSGSGEKESYRLRAYYTKLHKYRFLPMPQMRGTADFAGLARGQLNFSSGEINDYTLWGVTGWDQHRLHDAHMLRYGGEYNRYKVNGDNFSQAGSRDVSTYAAYLTDKWQVGKWLIQPLLRYDHHSVFGGKVTPHLGLTYQLNKNNRLTANWGKGYKLPGVSELYMDIYRGNYYIFGNPHLRPEESRSWDVSYSGEWGKTAGSITYFHSDIENRISTHRLGLGSFYTYYNIDKTKTHGVELSLSRTLTSRLSSKVTSTWTSASPNQAGGEAAFQGVDGIAGNLTTWQLTYDDKKKTGWNATLWQQWVHDYYESDTNETYSYQTTNLVINRKFNENTRLFAGVDNLFDKKIDAICLDGRLWHLGLEWQL